MVAVGIPAGAVKQKMAAEGLNPDLLDDPDAAAPPSAPVVAKSGGDSSSESDFSDVDSSSSSD